MLRIELCMVSRAAVRDLVRAPRSIAADRRDPPSVVSLLRARAAAAPEATAYVFLEDGESDETRVTYEQIDRRARAIAVALREVASPGERVLLLYPPGIDYVAGFFGCLYAEVIAVPAYPPDVTRLARTLPRLRAIVADCGARHVLTIESLRTVAREALSDDGLLALNWIATDVVPEAGSDAWTEPAVDRTSIAFLQYTSGSTGAPKGVVLAHGNLLHNSEVIYSGFDYAIDPVAVVWLPPYHDMGLIGGILQPLYGGFPAVSMSPLSFLQRPMRWLEAIARYRGTACGGPNFAYDLCVRKSTPGERAALDLRSWEIAFCGAEPIRSDTLARFAEAFAASGFERKAFYPCYGLAEGTLMSTGGTREAEPRATPFGGKSAVGCGTTRLGQEVAIVDLDSRRRCTCWSVGEIWLRGESVASGYWNRPEETRAVFGARTEEGEGPFLRTGDLGFVDAGGELYVVGRAKDVVIVHGKKHHPHDLERAAEASHPAIRAGCSAAFGIEVDGGERAVLVAEVDLRRAAGVSDEIVAAIQHALWREHDIALHEVLLLAPGAVPKTSSGKLQRFACRAAYLDGSFAGLRAQTN